MTTSLSDSWRQNKSANRVVELANSLRSLRKVIGSLNPEKCTVTYNSGGAQSFNDRTGKLIAIDPTYALKSTPIDGNDFDVLVGLSVHEAMHTIVDSIKIICDNENMPKDIITPATIAVLGEEIYCDGYAKRHYNIPNKYVNIARNAHRVDVPIESWRKILLSWMNVSLYDILAPPNIPILTRKALIILIPASVDLYGNDYNTNERTTIYRNLAYKLQNVVASENKAVQDTLDKITKDGTSKTGSWAQRLATGDGLDELVTESARAGEPSTSDENMPSANESGAGMPMHPNVSAGGAMGIEAEPMVTGEGIVPLHSNGVISSKLNTEISKALELDSEDITNQLKTMVKELNIPVYKNRIPVTILSNADTAIQVDFNKKLYDQLRWLDRLKNNIGKKILHHEERGRVDRAALYRAPIDGKVFRVTRQLPKQDINISVLLDASNSMKSSTQVYDAAYTIHKVLPKVPIYSYSQDTTGVNITKHTVGNKFHKVKLGDTTPTGIAILATLNNHPKSLLFVFTDGASNKGIDPNDVFDIVPQEYPKAKIVYVVYRPGSRRQQITTTHINNQVEQINISTVDEVPELMREALKPWFGVA